MDPFKISTQEMTLVDGWLMLELEPMGDESGTNFISDARAISPIEAESAVYFYLEYLGAIAKKLKIDEQELQYWIFNLALNQELKLEIF